ncbi:MAG: ABC transporter permease [Acidimicrobiales bacterium]
MGFVKGFGRLSGDARGTIVFIVVALAAAYVAYGIWDFKATAVLGFMVRYSTPLALAAMCGILCERTGVINIGIEGQMLLGAFVAFFGATFAGITFGVAAAVLAGGVLGAFLALTAVTWRINQIIAGTVINILAAGITSFFYRQGRTMKGSVPEWDIPLLSDIPLLGRVLFQNGLLTYLTFVIIIVLHVLLFRTPWGLRTRAVGEHPSAADTVGVDVSRYRYLNVTIAGGLAGLAGALLSVEATGTFERGMTSGRGFLALAIMIMGRWRPTLAWAAALFFGLLNGLVNQLNFERVIDVPPQFIGMLPYVLTIIVLAVFAGRVRAPAAAGQPYTKE